MSAQATISYFKLITKKLCFLMVLFMLCFTTSKAQLNYAFTEGKFLIKGTVFDVQTEATLSNVNIRINNTNRGGSCDADGNFVIYVYKTDTLKFTSVGYLPKVIHISDFDSSKLYTIQIQLIKDFIKLKEVTIYPYRDLEDFKKQFVEGTDISRVNIPGIAAPKYGTKIPKAKLSNPISFLYEKMKRNRSSANPDFKP